MDKLIPSASALVIHKGRILLVRSKTTKEKWGFPGGKQEETETPRAAATREIKEELGIDIQIKMELGSYIYSSHNRRFEIRCFVAETKTRYLRKHPGEIIEARWCTLEEGLALNLTSTTREALEQFASKYCEQPTLE